MFVGDMAKKVTDEASKTDSGTKTQPAMPEKNVSSNDRNASGNATLETSLTGALATAHPVVIDQTPAPSSTTPTTAGRNTKTADDNETADSWSAVWKRWPSLHPPSSVSLLRNLTNETAATMTAGNNDTAVTHATTPRNASTQSAKSNHDATPEPIDSVEPARATTARHTSTQLAKLSHIVTLLRTGIHGALATAHP